MKNFSSTNGILEKNIYFMIIDLIHDLNGEFVKKTDGVKFGFFLHVIYKKITELT